MDRLVLPPHRPEKLHHVLFAGVLVALFIFKWNDLHLPYFWDELGVYTQAADYQYHHGISLMPASVPAWLSRGHPLFFVALSASVLKLFGENVFAAHLFSLFISSVLLFVVYRKTTKYFDSLTALVAVMLLAIQPLFLAQSALVLPEITLALFVLLALTAYYEKRFALFALFASVAMLTKESAVVLPPVVIAWSVLVSLLSRNLQPGLKFKNLALTFTPYYLYGIFLLVQKQQNGWYFFPYHIDSVSFDPLRFKTGFNEFFNFVFWDHGRYWCEKILLIAGVFALLKGYFSVNKLRHSFLLLGGVFVLAFLMFSSLTFFMERYSLCLFPLQFIAVALAILSFSRNKIYIAVVTGFLCYTATTHFESHSFRNDSDLGYRHEVHTLQQAVEYVGAVAKPGEKVYGNFPAYFATGFKPGGYQNGFTLDAAVNFGAHPRYIIVSDPGTPLDKDFGQYNIQVLQTFVDGYAKAEVWRITPKDSLAR